MAEIVRYYDCPHCARTLWSVGVQVATDPFGRPAVPVSDGEVRFLCPEDGVVFTALESTVREDPFKPGEGA